MSNFRKLYDEKIVPELMKEHNYTTVMAVPKLEKIVINMGVGEGSKDEKFITAAVKDLEAISGQKCVVTKARKSIAGFKLREGQPVGVKVTLRGENMYNFISKSEKDTINFAKGLASKLHKGDIIVLTGELGSGKTKFTQGFLEYFGLENEISSPTFTIVNEYNSNTGLNIYHFDVYRLSDTDEFYAIGGDEYFENGICIIEWGELIKDALPKDYIHITFEKDDSDENYRKLKVETFGNKYQNLF